MADPVPLADPSGLVRAFVCGTCLRLGSSGNFIGAERLTPDQTERLAKSSFANAARCCACDECEKPCARRSGRRILCAECEPVIAKRDAERLRAVTDRDARYQEQKAAALKLSKDPCAAESLASAMSGASEDYWCASWLSDCEFELWSMVQGGSREWGFGEASPEEIAQLKELSERAGGWIVWSDELGGNIFVPAEEWARRYAERMAG